VKYCGETALEHMDKGYSVAVKKLGTIGVTVEIMRPGTKLPHEISIYSNEELKIQAAQAEAEGEDAQ
jgi:small subunit ribosomal protein S3